MKKHYRFLKIFFYPLFFVLLCNNTVVYAQSGQDADSDSSYLEDTEDVIQETDSGVEQTDSLITLNQLGNTTPLLRTIPDSVLKRLKSSKDFEYANDPAYWVKQKVEQRNTRLPWELWLSSKLAQTLVYLFFILVILFAVFRIVVANKLFLFYSPPKKKLAPSENLTEVEDDDLDLYITQAINKANYTEATRLLYIKTLRVLNAKGLIQFHPEATNHEYQLSMTGHKSSEHFNYLTRIYDYVCYGKFDLTQTQFNTLNKSFEHFHNLL